MPTYTRPLHPALARYVDRCVGYVERMPDDAVHHGLPSTSVTAIVAFDDPVDCRWIGEPDGRRYWTLVGGLHDRPAVIHTHGRQHGVQLALTPLGLRGLLGMPAAAVANLTLTPDEAMLFPPGLVEQLSTLGWRARFDLLERHLLERLTGVEYRHRPELAWAWARLTHGARVRVADVADEIGWSRRHLLTQFRAEFGLSPQTVARIGRFATAKVLAVAGVPLAEAAHRCGFADQAHLTREWARFAGQSPRRTLGEFPSRQESLP